MQPTVQLLNLLRTKYNTRLTIPQRYLRSHGLQDCAQVYWIPQPDGALLKFIRGDELLALSHPAPHLHGGEP